MKDWLKVFLFSLNSFPVRKTHQIGLALDIYDGNLCKVETGSLEESYPVDLAELLIRMTDALPGSVIFDPYCGGSASLQAAMKYGHSFFGFEKDQRKITKYKKIIDNFKEE